MRLAVIGAGQIVAEFLPHATEVPGLELAAIQGRRREHLETLQEQFGIERVYTDLDECLADASVDTVWVALPNSLHFEVSRQALEAGKHVICEKPFVLEESELEELRALATARADGSANTRSSVGCEARRSSMVSNRGAAWIGQADASAGS